MAYTNIDDPSAYFQTLLWTGNSSDSRALTNDGNSNLQPDWVWLKNRDLGYNHFLQDSSRGNTKVLNSDSDAAESTNTNMVESFDTNGFTVGFDGSQVPNFNGNTFVGWQWKANGGTTSSNTDGSITSTVQANQDAGFSIVTFTGNGTDGATVGHGLGVVPAMVMFKCRDTGNTDWRTYHQSISPTNAISFNSGGAAYGASSLFGGTFTSTLLKVENEAGANRNTSPMVAYCFAEKQGYSKFGSYVGNGNANGAFVYTGFKPAFVITKVTDDARDWRMWDAARDTFNVVEKYLTPNTTGAEGTTSTLNIDFLSNGFKLRGNHVSTNQSGKNFIYMAFAENPFVTSTGIPTTAR
jgi:hypothetical protein